jgi:hypothetical protein
MTPHRCPVCLGAGKLWDGLPHTTAGVGYVPCHGCHGSGIVWEPAARMTATEILLMRRAMGYSDIIQSSRPTPVPSPPS